MTISRTQKQLRGLKETFSVRKKRLRWLTQRLGGDLQRVSSFTGALWRQRERLRPLKKSG
jgi:hypothetical protein